MLHDVFLRLHIVLGQIEEHHRELCNPLVRAQLAETILYYFVGGHPLHRLPVTYGMATQEGDQAVSQAVNTFLQLARAQAEKECLITPDDRQQYLRTPHIQTLTNVIYGQDAGHEDAPLSEGPIAAHRFHKPVYKCPEGRKPGGGRWKKSWRKWTLTW